HVRASQMLGRDADVLWQDAVRRKVQVARRLAHGLDLLQARTRVEEGTVDGLGELFDPKGHGRLAESRGLNADWVPNGLELEEGRHVPRRLPVLVRDNALDVVGGDP